MATLALEIVARNQAQAVLNQLKGGIADVGRQAQSVSDKMKDWGKGFSSAGKAMTAGLTLPILGGATAALKLAGDFEQTQIALTTMLGDAGKAEALFNEMREFSASTPFEFPQIAEAGKMLLAFGIDSEKVIPKLKSLGDIASGVDIPVSDLTLIYGQASVAGRVMTGDLNQLVGRGVPILSALAKVTGVNEAQVRKLAEEGKVSFADFDKAIGSLTENGGQFAGMMDAQSQSLLGLFSTFKDNITLTLADVGKVLIETFDLKGKLTGLNEFLGGLSERIASFAKNNPGMFKFMAIVAALAAAAGPLAVGLGWVMTQLAALGPVVSALAPVFAALTGPIGLVVAALAALVYFNWDNIRSFISAALAPISAAAPYASAALHELWAQLTGIGIDSYDTTEGIYNFVAALTSSQDIAAIVSNAIGDMGYTLYNLGNYFQLVVEDGDYLNDFLADMPTWMQPAVEWVGRMVARFIEMGGVTGVAVTAWGAMQSSVVSAMEIIQPYITDLQNWFMVQIPVAVAVFWSAWNTAWATISPIVTAAWGTIQPVLSLIYTWLQTNIPTSLGEVQTVWATAWAAMGTAVSAAWAAMQSAFATIQTFVTVTIPMGVAVLMGIWNSVFASISSTTSTTVGTVSTAWGQLVTILMPTINNVKTAFSEMVAGFSAMGPQFQELWAALQPVLQQLTVGLGMAAAGIGLTVVMAINIFAGAMRSLPGIVSPIVQQITASLNLISAVVSGVVNFVSAIMAGNWAAAWESAKSVVFAFNTFLQSTVGNALALTGGAIQLFGNVVSSVMSGFGLDAAAAKVKTFTDGVAGLVGWIAKLVKGEVTVDLGLPDWITNLTTFTWPAFTWPDYAAWTWPDYTAWTWPTYTKWTWPSYNSWDWPDIPTPAWLDSFLNALASLNLLNYLPGNAIGTMNWRGGLTRVGETGPEVVWLPPRSQIFSNRESMSLTGDGGGITVNVTATLADALDINQLAYQIADIISRRQGRR